MFHLYFINNFLFFFFVAVKAAFCDEFRSTIHPKNSIKSLKRSISNNDMHKTKLFKRMDDNNQYESIKNIIQFDILGAKKLVSIEPTKTLLTRPKRNIKPVQRF